MLITERWSLSAVMEAIEVTARFDTSGRVIPLSFTWQGSTYLVDSTGRRWQNQNGQHILVMVPSGRVFELIYVPSRNRWYLGRSGEGRFVA